MIELVEYIVKQLVSKPDEVKVEEQNAEGMVTLLLTVAPDDMGLVIGKAGQTIKAIRRILTIRAMSDGVRVNLELKETGDGPRRSQDENEQTQTSEEGKVSGVPDSAVKKSKLSSSAKKKEKGTKNEDEIKEEKPREEIKEEDPGQARMTEKSEEPQEEKPQE